jgi:ABC-type branched-subunit amino acid transport system ATPase component
MPIPFTKAINAEVQRARLSLLVDELAAEITPSLARTIDAMLRRIRKYAESEFVLLSQSTR